MGKRLFAMLLVSIVFVGIANTSIDNTDIGTYKYADAWNDNYDLSGKIESVDYLHNVATIYDIDLTKPKEVISQYLKDYDLDWDGFDKVSTTKIVSIQSAKTTEQRPSIVDASRLVAKIVNNTIATYDDHNKCIILLPLFSYIKDPDQQFCTLVHELIHSLLSPKGKEDDYVCPLEEGLTDYLTQKVAQNIGIDYKLGYPNECKAIEWLIAIYGEDIVIQVVRDNCLNELIDSGTKNGMSQKLNYALKLMRQNDQKRYYCDIVFDILAHLAINMGKESEVNSLLAKTIESYPYLDKRYLMKLLS